MLPKFHNFKVKKMKAQHTNETILNAIGWDSAWGIIENINSGLSIDEAIEHQIAGMMEDGFDESQFDAPYDPEQIRPILRDNTLTTLKRSATELRNYASAHPEAYLRDYDADGQVVRVVAVDDEEFHIIFGDDEDFFYEP